MPKKRYSIGYLTTAYKEVIRCEMDIEINWMWIANRTGSAAKIELAHVPQGSSVSEALDLINDHSLAANTYISNEVKIYVPAGDTIVAKSDSADALVLTLYGIEDYDAQKFSPPPGSLEEAMAGRTVRTISKTRSRLASSPGNYNIELT